MVYPALLPLMRTPPLRTDAPADLNALVRFAERRNLVSVRVPSHFKRSLLQHNEMASIKRWLRVYMTVNKRAICGKKTQTALHHQS
jgi:hypothetical protein